MKKLLSLLLALAIVISCVSMVTFNASAEDEAAPTVTDEFLGWKMTAVSDLLTGTPYMVTSSAGNVLTNDDIDENGSITRSFTVINDNDYELSLTVSFQGLLKWPSGSSNTWAKPNSNAESAFKVSAKSSTTISIKLDTIDEEGNVTFTRSGSTETAVLPVTQIFFRIDFDCNACKFNRGDSIVVLTNGLLENLTPTDNSNNTKLVAEKFYESSYDSLDYLTAENGDAEKGDTSFWSSNNASSVVTNIPESDVTNNQEDTNRVIKFTPTENKYSSIFYDYSRTIHQDRVNLLNGGGPGTYQLSFRYRVVDAENANKGTFKVYFASKYSSSAGDVKTILGDNTYTAATYSLFNCEKIVMTEEWAYYTGTFTITEDYYNMFFNLKAKLKALNNVQGSENATIFGIRICGADSAFKDGTYEYLFDDLEFKKVDDTKPVGVHYFVNGTSLNNGFLYTHQNAKFTADDVVTDANGKLYIPVRYTVYNYNNFDFDLSIYIQNYWSNVSDLKSTKKILARQAAEIGFNIPVVKIGDTYYYTSSADQTTGNKILKGAIYEPIENANLRVDTGKAAYPAGAGVIVATSDTNDPIYSGITASKYKDMRLSGGTGAGRAAFAYDLPDLKVTSTIPDHSTDYYIARKITVTEENVEHYYNTLTKNLFAIDQNPNNQQFTGTKTISYTVHNTSRKPLHISLQFQAEEGGEWTGGDAKDEQIILPGCKATLTTSLEFTNGVATMTVGETTKNVTLLDIFAHFSFYFVNESVDDTFYIESNAIYDPILNAPSETANISYLSVKDFTKCDNKIVAANVQIDSSLTVNYFATVSAATVSDGIVPTLRVTRGNDVRTIDGTLITDGEYAGKYLFAYTGVNAQCMADNIKAELIFDNIVLDIKDNYSVKQYAINLYNNTKNPASPELKALLADMLHYGAAAQEYMEYKTGNLATKDIDWTASNRTLPKIDDESVVREAEQNGDTAHKVTSVGLNISYVNKIYFRLGFTDLDNVEIKLTRNDVEIEYTTAVKDNIIIYTDAINATGFGDKYTITITNKETNAVNTVSYNVNAYIAAKSDSATVGNIVKTLYNYGMSAQAYGSQQ